MGIFKTFLGYLAILDSAKVAAAVGFIASALLPTLFHLNLNPQDQIELTAAVTGVAHQTVYWGNKLIHGIVPTQSPTPPATGPPATGL